ncbi:MAG: hypothetical protein P8X39_05430 [Desulfofustis sp.]
MIQKSLLHSLIRAATCLLLLLLSSCATTNLTTSWHDAAFTAQNNTIDDVLVIGLTKEETLRRLYEDGFAAKFGEVGVRAYPSYTLNIADIKPTRKAVAAAVAAADARYVLITRHVSTDTKQHYRPPEPVYVDPYYSRMDRYYPLVYREAYYRPGYSYSVTTVLLESNLYDAATGKLIWSAQSRSVDPAMTQKYLDELIGVFAQDLEKSGLLP